ncbi:MAG TPA: RagB/SusD family nutrient uptake outer membrane protein, partial [Candidatus Butyricimonas faecavium]|nr:RagB/SusD family nutrient uptake outer membrane protein [Candidatus Butyricimonas faecavium]
SKENMGNSKDICVKIMDESNDASEYTGGAYLGFSMIRIPEMYYIMAEALLEEGDKEKARKYLDAVVAARGIVKFADRDTGKDITLEDIMNERRKELFGEGQWWFCLKRLNWDIYVHALDATLKGSDKIYTLPLPTEELDPR